MLVSYRKIASSRPSHRRNLAQMLQTNLFGWTVTEELNENTLHCALHYIRVAARHILLTSLSLAITHAPPHEQRAVHVQAVGAAHLQSDGTHGRRSRAFSDCNPMSARPRSAAICLSVLCSIVTSRWPTGGWNTTALAAKLPASVSCIKSVSSPALRCSEEM